MGRKGGDAAGREVARRSQGSRGEGRGLLTSPSLVGRLLARLSWRVRVVEHRASLGVADDLLRIGLRLLLLRRVHRLLLRRTRLLLLRRKRVLRLLLLRHAVGVRVGLRLRRRLGRLGVAVGAGDLHRLLGAKQRSEKKEENMSVWLGLLCTSCWVPISPLLHNGWPRTMYENVRDFKRKKVKLTGC